MLLISIILGLSIGSFINAAVYRINPALPKESGVVRSRSILVGRSLCPRCGHHLAWWQLVPVLSYLVLRGRCHYCRQSISPVYPLIEIITAISFAFFYADNPLAHKLGSLAAGWLILAVLIFIILYDFQRYLILDWAVVLGLAAALFLTAQASSYVVDLIAALALGLFFGGIYLLSRGKWIGFGDVKLGLFLGMLGGSLTWLTLFLASWLGALLGLFLVLFKKKSLKSELPFGTFLGIAAIIVFIWETQILNFFQNVLGF